MKAKQYKKRSEIPTKYKWDLDDILQGKKIDDLINEYKNIYESLILKKDDKFKNSKNFLEWLKVEDQLELLNNKISNWLNNTINQNLVNPEVNKTMQEWEFIQYNLSKKMGPSKPDIFKNASLIKKWIANKEFDNYRIEYNRILEEKKHQLPKAIQEFRSVEQRADIHAESVFSILSYTELDFGYATSSTGKKIKITNANRMKLSENSDAKIRKTSMLGYRDAHLKHKESMSNLLFQHFKKITVWSKLLKHDSVIDYLIFPDRSTEKLLVSLYEAVQSNLKTFKDYEAIHKKVYKSKFKKAMTKFDRNVPLVNVKTDFTIEEMQGIILKAFKPFGKEYIDIIKKSFKERWVDYMAVDNKYTGAYSIGEQYGIDKKYILMNNDGTIRSLETLAHELGHSMHSYFAEKDNHIRNAEYSIFVAEIASIFNELILFDYLLNTTKSDKLKFKIRQQMAKGFEGTVLRQIIFSNYEYDMYKLIESGKAVSTYDAISKVYYDNSSKYALSKSKYNKDEQWLAVNVPHYYYNFYVYKYAIGQLAANILFKRYKKDGKSSLQTYIDKFLSIGSTLTPLETLRNIDIDLENPETYKEGFEIANENNLELKKLAKKLFKI
ncbi:MAG: oligoendopeptidase F [Mycoplasma sp.]|nr:oligoendopeptidase F [Mycoplasma sp.]